MNRRDFIQLMALQSATMFVTSRGMAQSNWIHDQWDGFFVTVVMEGAWDISLSLDPWTQEKRPLESDYFIEYRQDELIRFGNRYLGPAMQPVSTHLKDLSVINGIFMSTNDNGHESLLSYALSGEVDNSRGALNLEVATTLPPSFFSVLTTNPIPTGLRPNMTTQYSIAKNALNKSANDIEISFIENAKSGILAKMREAFQDQDKINQAADFYEQYKKDYSGDSDLESAVVTAAAFKHQLSRSAVFKIINNLDTHSAHPQTHMTEQKKGWEFINRLFTLFKSIEYKEGQSLFDKTTFYITSEFSRTPALNAAKGKDHNPWTNSVVVAGHGILGEQVLGASRLVGRKQSKDMALPYMTGLPFDFETGKSIHSRQDLTSASEALLPKHVMRTLADAMGLNLKVLGGGLHKMPALKGVLKG